MHITGDANPPTMEFNDIKIGDKVAIEMSAFHWIEAASEIHAIFREHNVTPPVVVQHLIGKVFEAMTPEAYRKALTAEYAAVQAQAVAMARNPFAGMGMGIDPLTVRPEDFNDEG